MYSIDIFTFRLERQRLEIEAERQGKVAAENRFIYLKLINLPISLLQYSFNGPLSLRGVMDDNFLIILFFLVLNAVLFGPCRDKTCLRGLPNNKGADQPAHPRRLFSAFVIRLLESFISKLASSESSMF